MDVNSPKLEITKTASPTTFIVGQAASYTITVNNTGTADTTEVSTIKDTIPAGLTIGTPLPANCTNPSGQDIVCTIAAGLAAGTGSQSFTINVTPTASATNGNNTAYVTGGGDPACAGATDCPGTVTVGVNSPKLEITKTASPTTFIVGQAASYTITVNNTGTADTTEVSTIKDTIPAGLTIGTPLPANCTNPSGQDIVCTIAAGLAAGTGSQSFTINVTPTASATNGDNTAYVTGGGDPACAGATDCPGTVTVGVNSPKLEITKTASPTTFIVGQAASYTITVNNTGTADTTEVSTIKDTIPAGLTIGTPLPANCTNPSGQDIVCTIAAGLAAGTGSQSFTINVTPTASATNGDNTAYVTGGGDPACAGETDCPGTVTVGINTATNITLEKAGPASALVNDTLVYTISLGNSGGTASGTVLSVADMLPAGVSYVSSAPGTNVSSMSCTGAPDLVCALTLTSALAPNAPNGAASFTITVTAPDTAGNITNYASVDPAGGNDLPVPGANCAPATSCGEATTDVRQYIRPQVSVPVDSRWMLMLLSGLLLAVGLRRGMRQRG